MVPCFPIHQRERIILFAVAHPRNRGQSPRPMAPVRLALSPLAVPPGQESLPPLLPLLLLLHPRFPPWCLVFPFTSVRGLFFFRLLIPGIGGRALGRWRRFRG